MANESRSARSFAATASKGSDVSSQRMPSAPFMARRVVVEVPATCANLGPGFDCLALALRLSNRFEVTLHPDTQDVSARPRLEIHGAPADVDHLALDEDNLFVRAFRTVCQSRDVTVPHLSARLWVRVPPGRGLGSSATAVVGGILAANALLGGPLGPGELLDLAITCEPGHHADNVAAALLGGLVVTGARDGAGHLASVALPVPRALRAVLFIPEMPVSTIHSRALLPATYSRADATFNTSHVALLLAALQTKRFELLGVAMEDRFHQPYREQLFPALRPLIVAAQEAGAHGVCLSGGGSAVLALVTWGAEGVRRALETTAHLLGVAGYAIIVSLSRTGGMARLIEKDEDVEAGPRKGTWSE